MQYFLARILGIVTTSTLLAMSGVAFAASSHDHGHEHAEAHTHASDDIYKGYFDDDQIENRDLSDWEGDWQSVFPLLENGTLDAVMAHKAAHGDKSAEAYREYYLTGYRTDVDRILIEDGSVTFYRDGTSVQGQYADDGYEILTYDAGNRGVRFIFEKTGGDANAPAYIQFSDHRIAPEKADHYHLYWGDDRAALLEELTNWPTYYPAARTPGEIVDEMLAH
jgi:zinc transport system substrate-binding protein